jgi:hypothetical protein
MPGSFEHAYYPVEIWTPLAFRDEQKLPRADAPRDLVVFTRLKPGVAFAQAKAEMRPLDKLTYKLCAHDPVQRRGAADYETGGAPSGTVLRDRPGLSPRDEQF